MYEGIEKGKLSRITEGYHVMYRYNSANTCLADEHRNFMTQSVKQIRLDSVYVVQYAIASPKCVELTEKKANWTNFFGVAFEEIMLFGRLWIEEEILVIRMKLSQGMNQASAIIAQTGIVVIGPFCVESDFHIT